MILESNGVILDFFEDFPRDVKNIGLNLSGGADSALILYLLVEMIKERNQTEVKIYPFHGIESEYSENTCKNIIDHIEKITNTHFIQPLYTYEYDKPLTTSKSIALKSELDRFKKKYNIEYQIRGISQGMENWERPEQSGDIVGETLIELSKIDPHTFPWATVNKKFIASQYEKFGLQNLSNMTNSCIKGLPPCRECWWCKERYWAFGSYDGGIQ